MGTTEVTLPDGAVEDKLRRLAETQPKAASTMEDVFRIHDDEPEIAWTSRRIKSHLEQFNLYLSGALNAQGLASALESNVTVA